MALISSLSQTIGNKINDNYPNLSKNIMENYSHYSGKLNENYPGISTAVNSSTAYVYSIQASIGDRFNSILEPVSSEEREITRVPPNESLANKDVIPLTGDREKIIHHILDLYSLLASKECFESYDDDVIYDDLIIYTTGLSNLKVHFYGIQKLFVKSTTEEYKILENKPNILRFSLSQKYTLPLVNRAVMYNSEIILEFNENKITKHIDRWHGKESGGEGMLRKGIAKFFTLLVSVPEN